MTKKTQTEQREDDFHPHMDEFPADADTPVTVGTLFVFARRLRSKAKWECRDGYYTTEAEVAKNEAMREVYEAISSELDELFGFNSQISLRRF